MHRVFARLRAVEPGTVQLARPEIRSEFLKCTQIFVERGEDPSECKGYFLFIEEQDSTFVLGCEAFGTASPELSPSTTHLWSWPLGFPNDVQRALGMQLGQGFNPERTLESACGNVQLLARLFRVVHKNSSTVSGIIGT